MRKERPSTPTHWLFLVTRPPVAALSSFLTPHPKAAIALLQDRTTISRQQAGLRSKIFSNYPAPSSFLLVPTQSIILQQYLFHSWIPTKLNFWLTLYWTSRYRRVPAHFSISSISSCLQVYMKGTSLWGLLCLTMVGCSAISKYVVFLCKNVKLVYLNISFFLIFIFPPPPKKESF